MWMYVRQVVGVMEMKKKSYSMLRWRHIELGGGDWIRPSVWPGKGVFAHGGLSSFAPWARVSVFEFMMLRL